MPEATSQYSEELVHELVQLRDEVLKYSQLSEREVATIKKVSLWIRALQQVVNEPIPLKIDKLAETFPNLREAHLVKDGVVELKDRRGRKLSVELEKFAPEVFVSVVQDSELKLHRIIEERYSQRAKLRELLRVDLVIERVPIYDKEIAYLRVLNQSDDITRISVAIRKEGDWAIYKRLRLAAHQETTVYLTALKVLESPLPTKFEIRCGDPKGNDYRQIFNVGPVPSHHEKLVQPIIGE